MDAMFPLFLKLAGRRVLLVGGGRVALGKLDGLLTAGAQVEVVAPEVGSGFDRRGVHVNRRAFVASDLDDVWLAIAAATPAVNRQVAANADARRIFVNAVDEPETASAYSGGVIRRSGVTVAVSTAGAAPALAGLLREALDALLPEDLEAWVSEAVRARSAWKASQTPIERRRPLLLEALNDLYSLQAEEPGP